MSRCQPAKMREGHAHILFVQDHLHMRKSGIYGLVRWTIRMLRKCEATKRVKITCTSCKSSKATRCDDDYIRFTDEYNIQTLNPSRLGYALRTNENELTVRDLNEHDKQYFRSLGDNDISHIVVMAPLTSGSCLNKGIVDRIKAKSKISKPEVIMLNQMSESEWISNEVIKELRHKLDSVICVGDRVYNQWLAKVNVCQSPDVATERSYLSSSALIYPTFEETKTENNGNFQQNHFIIATLYSKYLHQNNGYLRTLAEDIGESIKHLSYDCTVEWHIQWSYDDISTQEKKREENELQILSGSARERLKIKLISKEISTLLPLCSLCIQPGFLDTDGYSGLETLLAGIPTLVSPLSDVHEIIRKVTGEAEFFTYDSQAQRSVQGTYNNKIYSRLHHNKVAFVRTSHFQNAYCKYKGRIGHHESTVEGIRHYLNVLTGNSYELDAEEIKSKIELLPVEEDIWQQERYKFGKLIHAPEVVKENAVITQKALPLSTPFQRETSEEDTDSTVPKTRLPSNIIEGAANISMLQTDDLKMLQRGAISSNFAPKSQQYMPAGGALAINDISGLNQIGRPMEVNETKGLNDISGVNQMVKAMDVNETMGFNTVEMESEESASAEIGIGAKPKLQPKTSLRDFLKTYKRNPEDRNKPRKERKYKVIVIPPKNPTGKPEDDIDSL